MAPVIEKRAAAKRMYRARHAGLTLIEVMIALLIGAILSLVAGQIFISANHGYRTNDALARIQENGRYAMTFLRRDIRSADFWGCAGNGPQNNSTIQNGPDFPGPGVGGTDNAAGSDTITIQGARSGTSRSLTTEMPNTSANLFLNNSTGIAQGDFLVVTNCDSADALMVTGNNTNNNNLQHNAGVTVDGTSNSTAALSRVYGTSARVYSARQVQYSINADSELVRSINGGPDTVLVYNVPGMEITYGVDFGDDGSVNTYVPATDVPDWQQVLAVRIALLLRSDVERITDEVQIDLWDFNGDGTLDDAPDNRMYQRFSGTIRVRNRIR